MEWFGYLIVVVLIIVFILYAIRRNEQTKNKTAGAAKVSTSAPPSKPVKPANTSENSDWDEKIRKLKESAAESETKLENAFIEEMQPFLDRHGTVNTNVHKLLDYAKKKAGVHFNSSCVKWTAQPDGISCNHEWSAHSFFDDGGGEKGCIEWSFFFAGSGKDYLIQNDKLNDLNRYFVIDGTISESFYCENPFGLKGIYKVSCTCTQVFTD